MQSKVTNTIANLILSDCIVGDLRYDLLTIFVTFLCILLCFQFLCCKNIKTFLDVCRSHFGIREADLFEPTMLYDLENFHRVLITLSKLSQCRKVLQLHPDLM